MVFFQLEILRTEIELSISRIGYEAVIIQVPEVDKFQIKLKKEFVLLPFVDLARPPIAEADIDPFWQSPIDSFPNNTNATYQGGWRAFRDDVMQVLKTDAVLASLTDTLTHVMFTAEIDGSTSILSVVPENKIIYDLFKSSNRFNNWRAAVQNNKPITQFFDLRLGKDTEWRVVEETATPVGGLPEFYKFVNKNLKYPLEAKKKGIEGKVFVQFVIQKDGSLLDIKIFKNLGYGCDEEAIRIISIAPKWNPGKQRGKPVVQRYVLPIIFKR